jgi:hypothetical protein
MVEERMIYHGTLSSKADPTARGTGWRSDLEIRFRRGSAVERELGLAGHLAPLHGRKVEAGLFHRALDFLQAQSPGRKTSDTWVWMISTGSTALP